MARPTTDRVNNLVRRYGTYKSYTGEIGVKGPYQYTEIRWRGPQDLTKFNVLNPDHPVAEFTSQISKNWVLYSAFLVIRNMTTASGINEAGVWVTDENYNNTYLLMAGGIITSPHNGKVIQVPAPTIANYNSTAPTLFSDEVILYPYLLLDPANNNDDLDIKFVMTWFDRTK